MNEQDLHDPELSSEEKGRRAVKSAFGAYYVDMLDVYLPVLVLTPAIAYFVHPDLSPAWTAVVSATIFIGTLLGRPVGAGIFGHFADVWGRRKIAILTMFLSGLVTILMGLTLGYEQWGLFGVILFVVLRFLNGTFIGGQYTSALPLAMEYAPEGKRGWTSGKINTSFPLGYATIAITTLILLAILPSDGLDSPYVQWGWRIPFIIVGVLELALAWNYYRNVSESEVWEHRQNESAAVPNSIESHSTPAPKQGFRSLLSGEARKSFIQVFIMVTGLWLSLQAVAAILPGVLSGAVGLEPIKVSMVIIISYLILVGGQLSFGWASDRFGRKPTFMTGGLMILFAGSALYWVLVTYGPSMALWSLIPLVALIVVIIDAPFAPNVAYITERFAVNERATGYGLSYSLGIVIPSFYAYYQLALSNIMPFEYTVIVLVAVGGLLIIIGAAMGPETRDVNLHHTSEDRDEAARIAAEEKRAAKTQR